MSDYFDLGIYRYKKNYETELQDLPQTFTMNTISLSALIMQLLMGKISILSSKDDSLLFNDDVNYTMLPCVEQDNVELKHFEDALGLEVNLGTSEINKTLDTFFNKDRKNTFIYERVLNELSEYFVKNSKSPCEGFVHLYRLLEFMSYSFPLIYASISIDYKGTYENFKKFFKNDGSGELKFFKNFLVDLFKDDTSVINYPFEIEIESENAFEVLKDFKKSISANEHYEIKDEKIRIKFDSVHTIFIEIRNKYFHMLIGSGQNNFLEIDYDKNDLFRAVNPIILNWFAIIFMKILSNRIK